MNRIANFCLLAWSFFHKRTKLFFILTILLMPVIALAELIQIATIVPLMNKLLDQKGLVSIAGYEVDVSLINVTIFFSLISITVSILRFLGIYSSNYASLKALENISTSIFRERLYGDFSKERGRRSSDTMNLFTNKLIYLSAHFIFPIMTILQSIILVCAIIVFLMYNISEIFIILALSVLTLYSIYTYISKSRTKVNANQISIATQQHTSIVADLSQNIRELKLYGREKLTFKKFQEIERKLRDRQISVQLIAHGSKPIVEGSSYVALAVVILFSVQAGYTDIIPKLALLAFGVQKLLPATQSIYSSYSLMISGKEMVDEIFIVLSGLKNTAEENKSYRSLSSEITFVDKITISNLAFKNYGENWLLYPKHEFQLGKLNLIFGKSGTGKTTLTDLITGLLKPNTGKIKFLQNGRQINSEIITFAYCSQTPIIFDDDLSSFKYDFSIKKELGEAVNLNFLENKSEIHVGNLSGGEKQRIGIARALLSASSIYIFDEPTASLDEFNANKLIEKLKKFSLSHFVIIVSHDPRIINEADNKLDLK